MTLLLQFILLHLFSAGILYNRWWLKMAEIIITAVISVFFVIGVYTTVKEMWSLLTDSDEEKPP